MKYIIFVCSIIIACSVAFSAPTGEISVWCMGSEGNQIPTLARAFEKEFPGTKINTQGVPWNGAHDRLITSVAGNIAPDITQLGTTWVPEFAAMGALMPLNDLLNESTDINENDFYKGPLETGKWGDNLYALPWYVDVRVIFYRSDILKEAGWDHYPETWEELSQLGADIRAKDINKDKINQYAFNFPARDEQVLLPFIWQAGAELTDPANTRSAINTPEGIEALAFYQSLFKNKYTPGPETGQIDPFVAFHEGFFLSWITGPWMVGEYQRRLPAEMEGRWKVAPLPRHKNQASFLGGCNLAIFKQSQNPELAWAFIQYLLRSDVQLQWNEITGNLPAVKEAWESPKLADHPIWSVFRKQLESAHAVPVLECWEAMAEVLKNEMENLAVSDADPAKAAANIEKEFNFILANRRSGQGNLPGLLPILVTIFIALFIIISILLALKEKKQLAKWEKWRVPALFLLPIMVHLTIFVFIPILVSFFLSFTNYDIYSIGDWKRTSMVGTANYSRLWEDGLFWRSVINTAYFVIVSGPLTIAAALGAALLLNRKGLFLKGFFRTGFFLPVVTPLVAVAVVWRWIYSPQHGLLNWAIGLFGISEQTWLADTTLAMPCLISLSIWKNFGYSMVIFLAGLQAIPPSMYEAASIDGASPWNRFWNITLPLLKPTTVFVTIITTIGYMQFFAEPYVMTEMGGPQNRTLSVVLYLYKEGFKFFHLGYASAIAYVLCAVIAIFSIGQLLLARKSEGVA